MNDRLDLTDDKSILVQVMAWCRQATSHFPGDTFPSIIVRGGGIVAGVSSGGGGGGGGGGGDRGAFGLIWIYIKVNPC